MLNRRTLLTSLPVLPLWVTPLRAAILQAAPGDQTAGLQSAINKASETGGVVQLGAGTFETRPLTVKRDLTIVGIPGATTLRALEGGKIFSIFGAKTVIVQGLVLLGKGTKGNLVAAEDIERLVIEDCDFGGGEAGIRLANCGGRIVGSRFRFHQQVGVQAIASTGLDISGNTVSDCGNLGIQIFRNDKGDNATIVSNNFVTRIAAEDGGDGPNGNGINVYASHGVIVANNRISDCAFTGIRNASSDMCTITGNQITRCNEVGMYVEFEFSGVVVSNNIVDTASYGISITNSKQGGKLAQCTGNVVRNIKGNDAHGRNLSGGIGAEADTLVANNVVENVASYGIALGWGAYANNLSAIGNIVKDCPQGIRFSAVGPGPFVIANNVVSGATGGAILGMDHDKPVTEDLAKPVAKVPSQASISGNVVRS